MTEKSILLDNGMRIATDAMDSIETVSVSVLVKTGSRYETKENNGISHFLEHMAFKGTKTRSAKQIAEEFDMIGGYFNAYTSREKTVYYAKVLKDDLEVAVDILADILQNSTYDNEEIEKERSVILQEIAQTVDTPDDIIFEHFQDKAYPNQPFGRSILGTPEFVSSVTRDNILEYVDDMYGYNNIIIAGAGNLNHDDFRTLIKNKFKTFPKKSSKKLEAASYSGGDCRINKDLEQVHIVMGLEGVSYLDDEYYTQQVLSLIAGGGMSSRLFQEVREKRGLAYTISAFGSSYSDCGLLGIYSGTSEDKANELMEVVCNELHKLTEEIHEDELQRAKAQVRAGLLMSQESSVARAEKVAGNYAAFGRYIPIQEIIEKIESIDVNAVKDFMKKILTKKSRPTLASIGKIDKLYDYDKLVSKLAQ